MVRLIKFSRLSFFIGQKCERRKSVFGDERPVGLGRIFADPEYFYFSIVELCNVSLKLNEFWRSISAVVFRIKSEDGPSIIFQNLV